MEWSLAVFYSIDNRDDTQLLGSILSNADMMTSQKIFAGTCSLRVTQAHRLIQQKYTSTVQYC